MAHHPPRPRLAAWLPLLACVAAINTCGCEPSTAKEIAPFLGKPCTISVSSDIDPASALRQRLEDVELIRLGKPAGEDVVLIRFTGFTAADSSDQKPIEIWFPLARILEIEIDGKVVWARAEG